MASEPHPWDKRSDESPKAYAAFCCYRDLGPTRSIDKVGAQLRGGQPDGKRAAGRRLFLWSSEHRWGERSAAYDAFTDAERVRGAARAARARGELWAQRLDRQRERAWSCAQRLLDQAEIMAGMPVVQQSRSEDGKTVIFEAIDPRHLKAAAQVLRVANEVSVISATGGRGAAATVPELPDLDKVQAQLDEAARQLAEWRREMAERAGSDPTARMSPPQGPPALPPPMPEPTEPAEPEPEPGPATEPEPAEVVPFQTPAPPQARQRIHPCSQRR